VVKQNPVDSCPMEQNQAHQYERTQTKRRPRLEIIWNPHQQRMKKIRQPALRRAILVESGHIWGAD
jgi:hypothetical protein